MKRRNWRSSRSMKELEKKLRQENKETAMTCFKFKNIYVKNKKMNKNLAKKNANPTKKREKRADLKTKIQILRENDRISYKNVEKFMLIKTNTCLSYTREAISG